MSSVYFIEAVGLERIKIGSAKEPAKRLKELQTGSPAPLRVVATIAADNARRFESALHAAFQDARVVGEWFHVTKTLRRLVTAAASIPTQVSYAKSEPGGVPTVTLLRIAPHLDEQVYLNGCVTLLEACGYEVLPGDEDDDEEPFGIDYYPSSFGLGNG